MANTFVPDGFVADGDGASPQPRLKTPDLRSPGLTSQPTAQPVDAARLAGEAAQAAGTGSDAGKALAAASTAVGAAQALADGASPGQALAGAGLQAAGLADPKVAQAAQTASLAKSALEALNLSSARAETDLPGIDDNPRAGQAVADFASAPPMQQFVPALADGGESSSIPAGMAAALGFDENTRLLRLDAPLPPDKQLLVASIDGTAGLSEVGGYSLRLLSEHQAIDHKDVLSKNMTVSIRLADGGEHAINGYVGRFGYSHTDGALAVYDAELVPWLWFLDKRVNSRIFQQVTAEDVLSRVFKEYGALAEFEFRLFKPLPEETYLVQYGESDLNFVSRVMERYGLFYYFEHSQGGHTLVISDDSTHPEVCPAQPHHPRIVYRAPGHTRQADDLLHLSSVRELQPGLVSLNTYDYKQPGTTPYVEQTTIADQGDSPTLEVYDGNPAYAYRDQGDGERDALRRMEAYEWQAKLFFGQTQCRGMVPGATFQIGEHPALDSEDPEHTQFLVIGMRLSARNNYNGLWQGDADGAYENRLTLIRRKIPYRPVPRHPKPVMRGPQTATVVGAKGQEIHTDDYGRIKVQFPWDREGRNDQGSSCWIRVSQPWAGRGWGTVAIPRINQEVIIDFIEGDPDRPVVTGRLFNGDQRPPTGLPDAAHVMGFISRSTPGGGGFCEMTIHDQAGEELVNIHSQKDMCTTVQNNMSTVVNGPEQTNVVSEGLQTNTVKKSIEITSVDEHIGLKAHTAIGLLAETEGIDATAKTSVEITAETEQVEITAEAQDVLIKGKTAVRLEAGDSSLELREDGTVLLNGKLVQIVGSDSIDLNP